jgi:hypothetical protein
MLDKRDGNPEYVKSQSQTLAFYIYFELDF